MTKTVPWGRYSGVTKIIPPEGWLHSVPPITKRSLANVRIKKPIQQNMIGQAGQFRQTNVEKLKNKPLTLQQWFAKSQHRNFLGPGPKDLDRTLDRDSEQARAKRAAEAKAKEAMRAVKRAKKEEIQRYKRERRELEMVQGEESEEDASREEQEQDEKALEKKKEDEEGLPGPSAPVESMGDAAKDHPVGNIDMIGGEDVPPLDPSSAISPPSSSDPLATTPEPEAIPEFYQNFRPTEDWLPPDTKVEDYTPEACATMERKFWKNIGLGEPSWYGADLQGTSTSFTAIPADLRTGSLFEDEKTPWNVAHLPNLLNRLHRSLPGVNEPYLYFGLWRAAFAWHVEDVRLVQGRSSHTDTAGERWTSSPSTTFTLVHLSFGMPSHKGGHRHSNQRWKVRHSGNILHTLN